MDQNLIEKIDEIVKQNKEFTRDMNEKLNHIRGGLTKKTEDVEEAYDRGLRDMWEVVLAFCSSDEKKALTGPQCREIFGTNFLTSLANRCTYREAINLHKTYKERIEKEKSEQEKEAQTFKRGDIVMCHSIIYPPDSRLVVYIGETEHDYDVLYRDHNITQLVSKENYYLTKTGKHIDMDF